MQVRSWAAAAAVFLGTIVPASAHDGPEAADGKGRLGRVVFANSCAPAVQADFQRAMAMAHSFWYSAGEQAFRSVLARDPGCAIANFGIAVVLMNNPLAGQGASAKSAEVALAAIEQGRRNGAKTQRERDYLEAVAAYYADFGSRPERARQVSRAQAFEALAARYPKDDEAQIFSALYIAGTQLQSDQTYSAYLKAAAILEPLFARYPQHPGVAHYLIHSYDAPPIAAKGLPAARRYAAIAPDAPHALHMPSHIFTRVGAWKDSVAANRRSADVAKRDSSGVDAFHAADYMVYAELQLGRDRAAQRVIEEFNAGVGGADPALMAFPYAAAAMPARMALERGDWTAASRLTDTTARFPFVKAITAFSRSLGAARNGDVAAAERDAEQLAGLHKTLVDAKNNYWATEVEVQRLAAAAWIAHARGSSADALKLMRAAADLEDRSEKHIVSPGRVVPARELLGEMLLEQGQPAVALAEFEASQKREPNRLRGFAGAAHAAEAAGDAARARQHYATLATLTRDADTLRPELARARAYVASR